MKYDVKLTRYATGQVADTVSYISKSLLVPDTAAAWAVLLEKEIAALSEMPGCFPLVDKEPWTSKGIRKTPVKKFIVYYFVNENTKTVWVTAVVYGGRNQLSALREMPD